MAFAVSQAFIQSVGGVQAQELCLIAFSGHVSMHAQHSEHSLTFGQVDFSFTTSNTSEGQMFTHSPHPVHRSSSISIVNPASPLYVFFAIVQPPVFLLK